MALIPHETQRGLWTNPDLKAADAGVFALIIGVSRYDYLADGAKQVKETETLGLGQLGVSALTAYRFFEWLRQGYVLKGWPVAQVRLLLSPLKKGVGKAKEDELAGCDRDVCSHAVEANFLNCKSAIENWHADLEAIGPKTDGRSLFFFTGHGLEIRRLHQVLLPSDYCRPPGKAYNDAISTRNLIDNLPLLPRVSSHILLLDACRNDLEKFRGKGVEGAKILNDDVADATNTTSVTGVLHSTQSGHQAYQPKKGGLSLFGQAVLDGLKTMPNPELDEAPIELNCRSGTCRVEINSLTSYVKGRIAALVKDAKEHVVQEVRVDVSSPDPKNRQIDLNEIDDPHTRPGVFGQRGLRFDVRGPLNWAAGLGKPPWAAPEEPQRRHVSAEERAAWLDSRYSDREITVPPLQSGATGTQTYERLHDFLGSESITYPWLETLRVRGLATGKEVDQSAVEIISTRVGERAPAQARVQVQLRIAHRDTVGHLLTIKDTHGQQFGCVLPSDTIVERRDGPIYQLEIDVGETDAGRESFIRFAASLSPKNPDQLGTAARTWERLRALDPAAAADLIKQSDATAVIEEVSRVRDKERARFQGPPEEFFHRVEDVLARKVESPLAAAVAGLVLLKANRFDLMHDWARNVGNWFPWLPDGVVLWTEQCRRMASGKLDPQLVSWFVTNLSERSLPFTSDCFGLAADILRDVLRGRIGTNEAVLHDARLLNARFDAVMDSLRDDALFCTYAGWDDAELLWKVVAPPAAQNAQTDAVFDIMTGEQAAGEMEAAEEAPSELIIAEPEAAVEPVEPDRDQETPSAGA
jgi:hypothetical protein